MGLDEVDRRRQEFEEAALVHMDVVYNAALRLTRNKTEAEDLFQETFLRAYRFFHQFQRGTDCRAWLFTILHNIFINRVRDRSRTWMEFDEKRAYREAEAGTSPLGNPEVDLIRGLVGEEIRRAVEAIPPKLRAAVILADLEGFSYREIAKICGCPIGTVMSRLYRGRQMLKAALKEYAKGKGHLGEEA
jgi:RNA polymerase sigma-70 factor (ECF subfamily)